MNATQGDEVTDSTKESGAWVAGWNMPGYLPEMEPCSFETFDDAKRFIIDEMERCADHCDEYASSIADSDPEEAASAHERAEQLSSEQQDLNLERRSGDPLGSGLGVLLGDNREPWGIIESAKHGLSWWITYDPEATTDEEL